VIIDVEDQHKCFKLSQGEPQSNKTKWEIVLKLSRLFSHVLAKIKSCHRQDSLVQWWPLTSCIRGLLPYSGRPVLLGCTPT
jgi:hypothetical protein